MGRHFKFDVRAAIVAAWDLLWADNLKRRLKEEALDKKLGRKSSRFASQTYYLTASDLEDQVRSFAEDTAQGRPWRKERAYGGYGFRVRLSGDLQSAVRDFLLRGNGGRIVGHNFGKGHISGMRFRPAGEPISPSEEKTIAAKAERRANPRRIVEHYSETYGGYPLCTSESATGKRVFHFRPSKASVTKKREEVTCRRCLNLLASIPPDEQHDAHVRDRRLVCEAVT
jgi:hypothetical protein